MACKPSQSYLQGNTLQGLIDDLKKNAKIDDFSYGIIQYCVLIENGSLKGTLQLNDLSKQANELSADIKKYLEVQAFKLEELSTYIAKIQTFPDKPDLGSGTSDPSDQAALLSSWADCSKTNNN